MWQVFICLRIGAVTESWTHEWDFESGEIKIECWLNGGYFAFKEGLYRMGNMDGFSLNFIFEHILYFLEICLKVHISVKSDNNNW